MRRGFLEKSVASLLGALDHASHAEELAARRGLLQSLDPRAKAAGLFALIAATAWTPSLAFLGGVFAAALALAAASGIAVSTLARRVWLPVLFFTGVIALPAVLLTPGETLATIPAAGWTVTRQGLRAAALLIARAGTAGTLCALLVFSTPWTHVLKALRVFRVPVVAVVILAMTWRYAVLLLQTARDMFESRRSRMVGPLAPAEASRVAAASAGVLLSKTMSLGEDVYLAMRSRGYRGEVYMLDEFRMRVADWAALASAAAWVALLWRWTL